MASQTISSMLVEVPPGAILTNNERSKNVDGPAHGSDPAASGVCRLYVARVDVQHHKNPTDTGRHRSDMRWIHGLAF